MDIYPTMLDLLNIKPQVFLDGSSLVPIMNGETRDDYSQVSTYSNATNKTDSPWIPGKVTSFIVGIL